MSAHLSNLAVDFQAYAAAPPAAQLAPILLALQQLQQGQPQLQQGQQQLQQGQQQLQQHMQQMQQVQQQLQQQVADISRATTVTHNASCGEGISRPYMVVRNAAGLAPPPVLPAILNLQELCQLTPANLNAYLAFYGVVAVPNAIVGRRNALRVILGITSPLPE